MNKHQSQQDQEEGQSGAMGQRIAELAELVAAGCKTPVPSSYVREEFEALVDEIRARAGDPSPESARRSSLRLKTAPTSDPRPPADEGMPLGAFDFGPDSRSSRGEYGDVDASGFSRIVSLDDARRVLDAIHREETSGEGPREDLQRAIA